MKIPYSQVHVNGGVIFAGRSGQVQTFSLATGDLISTWTHPDVGKVAAAVIERAEVEKEIADTSATQPETATEKKEGEGGDEEDGEDDDDDEEGEEEEEEEEDNEDNDDDQPPTKRQKTADPEHPSTSGAANAPPPSSENAGTAGDGSKKVKKGKNGEPQKKPNRVRSQVPDRPIVSHLASTDDGKYVVGVTGHDKAIWVWEHDGQGHLVQLSSRLMPKRPSAIVVTPDAQILCADKFGDVYSLPLVPTGSPSATATGARPRPATMTQRLPAANELTVHSKRNLEALRDQQKQLENAARRSKAEAEQAAGPEFELTLQLGHVSMLTGLVLAERPGDDVGGRRRRFIISSDRDEHIRVSRYMPQAHVIEAFCMGHRDFVGAMVVPPSRPDLLVSGGGDPDLHLWDWATGRLLSRTSLLPLAQSVQPDVADVAVSKLCSFVYLADSAKLTYVAAICEGIKAILTWQLTDDGTLHHPVAIQLPGNPLSMAIATSDDVSVHPKMIVAIDPDVATDAPSLSIFPLAMSNGRIAVDTAFRRSLDAASEVDGAAAHLEATEQEIRNLLYGVAALRKQKIEEGAPAPEPVPEVDAPAA